MEVEIKVTPEKENEQTAERLKAYADKYMAVEEKSDSVQKN